MAIESNQQGLASDFVSISSGASDIGKVPKLNTVGQLEAGFFKSRIVRIFTSSGTWTKPASLVGVIAEVQGPGGGGGVASSTNWGGGGGAGTYAKMTTTAAVFTTSSVIVVVGTGGGGRSGASVGTGSAGSGPSSFGGYLYAPAGNPGESANGGEVSSAATGIGVDISILGQGGSGNGGVSATNFGGSSFLGRGAVTRGFTPKNGNLYGSGGAPGRESATQTDSGSGANGIVIITELYS